ncbi:MAG: MBL fold metallo-hydrolase [Peptococcaceae bacterium]|nr:MBL fold metallo-hydrolase [Peptococcaceae bacterium]
MLLEVLPVGALQANCYIIGCDKTKQAFIIDPGDEPEKILAAVRSLGVTVAGILLTHGHADHIGAASAVKKSLNCPVYIHPEDSAMLTDSKLNLSSFLGRDTVLEAPDHTLTDGQGLHAGEMELTVAHTPGHTAGGVCFIANGVIFSGDTLFAGSIGRTDLPGGEMETLIASIKNKLLVLPDETRVYPGHGPLTTIGEEKRNNPFLNEDW